MAMNGEYLSQDMPPITPNSSQVSAARNASFLRAVAVTSQLCAPRLYQSSELAQHSGSSAECRVHNTHSQHQTGL